MMDQDFRDHYIARVVRGKSFADVGGLWGTVNEKVSVAHRHGAQELTMIDLTPEGDLLWTLFHARMKSLGIAGYDSISSDVCDISGINFDVVHSSGVLYHHPNPMQFIEALRHLTREYLVLTSAITQISIDNAAGVYRIPPSGIICVPALNDQERAVLAHHWRAAGVDAYGITRKIKYQYHDFSPWWFLPTAEAMTAMCEAAGFKTAEGGYILNNNAYTLLLSVD